MAELSEDYLIETSDASPVSMDGFIPRQRVAFIIQGIGGNLFPSFNMIVDCLVQRGYSTILALGTAKSALCRETRPLYRPNIEGLLGELTAQLSSDDVLFTAVLGSSYTKTGSLYIPLHDSSALSAVELRALVSRIPVHHAVHYLSPHVYAGDFAQILGGAQHPDFCNGHIALSPTTPDVHTSSLGHTVTRGQYQSVEVVTPFHAKFFDPEDYPTLEARFQAAAKYQRKISEKRRAYMRYGVVHPQGIAFRPQEQSYTVQN
jgi:hypothetical protein